MCIACVINRLVEDSSVQQAGKTLLSMVASGMDLASAADRMKAELLEMPEFAAEDEEVKTLAFGYIDQAAAEIAKSADRLRAMADNLFPRTPDTTEEIQ